MEQLPHLDELVLMAAVGVIAALLVMWLRLPAVAGLLLAGAVVGPYGLALVPNAQTIEALAEVGVIFLLFTIGLEFSLSKLRRIARVLVVGGTLQVGLTVGATVLVTTLLGGTVQRGLFFGFIVALSSTAIVLRGLAERRELDAPHGRLIVGTLIFQDLCVVPMMLTIPLLAGGGSDQPVLDVALALGKAAGLVVLVIVLARFLVPGVFARVDATRSREVFLLAVLVVCIGTAWLTSLVGLSLALGAFLAGVVLAESDFGHRALSDVLPLRDLFTSVFFMSLGMLFDVQLLRDQPLAIGLLFVALFLGKGLLATVSVLPLRPPLRVAVLAGVGLAQFGEFGFVVAKEGLSLGLLTGPESRLLLTAGVLTMFVTPVAIRLAPTLAAGAERLQGLTKLLGIAAISDAAPEHTGLSGHVVIGGYGVAGRVLGQALRRSGVPYLVMEINAECVERERAAGEPIYYGDVSAVEALEHAHVGSARAVVLLINDPDAARRALDACRRHAPQTPVLLRTHYFADRDDLLRAGAADVVCEEIESGVEMLARVLRRIGFPRNVLIEQLQRTRADTAASVRDPTLPRPRLGSVAALDELKVESFLVRPEAYACGRSPSGLALRAESGALVIALRRGEITVAGPAADAPFEAQDVLYLLGPGPALVRAIALLERGPEQPASVSA